MTRTRQTARDAAFAFMVTAGLVVAVCSWLQFWSAGAQNKAIAALAAGRDIAVGADAAAPVGAARARFLAARGNILAAQAIADRMTQPADAAVRADLLYTLANAQFRHGLTMIRQVPFRLVKPVISLALSDYRQALVIDPGNWDARYNFALAAALVRDTEPATPTSGSQMSHERAAWPDIPGAPNGMP
jgi:mxaK protein